MTRTSIAVLLPAAAMAALSCGQAGSAQTIENYGMRAPGNAGPPSAAQAVEMLRKGLGSATIQSLPMQVPELGTHWLVPGFSPGEPATSGNGGTTPRRLLADPVVASGSVGFFNATAQALKFKLAIGDRTQVIGLEPHEVVTIKIEDPDAQLAGTIGTGDQDPTLPLTRGAIYVLRAEDGKWVLAAL